MTTQLVKRLTNLAEFMDGEYGPKLRAAADDVEHKLEAWTSEVDRWVELHFDAEAEKVREEAGAAYREAVKVAHDLIAKAKATFDH